MPLAEKFLTCDLHSPILNRLSRSISGSITKTFPDTNPPHITHSLFLSSKDFSKRVNIYPTELPGTEPEEVKRAYYDLGAETINYWLLNEACSFVIGNLPQGVAHGLKGLSMVYHLDFNPGYKELEKMGRGTDPKNLKSVINKTLFSHEPGGLTQYWNTHNDKKIKKPDKLTTEDFILDIGRLACPDKNKILSKMQQLTPNWVGDFEAQVNKSGVMLQSDWLKFATIAELFGSVALFGLLSQLIPATIMLGSSITKAGLSILDEIYKNIYMRSISETHFGIREIKWD